MIRWLLASIHLLGLGIGLGAIWVRARAFNRLWPEDSDAFRSLFAADTLWGVAALIWISSGLIRAFGGVEKGTSYYVHNDFFLAKMTLLALVLLLEVRPMVMLIRWRKQRSRGVVVDTAAAGSLARMSYAQAVLIVLMVCAATAMARGYGTRG